MRSACAGLLRCAGGRAGCVSVALVRQRIGGQVLLRRYLCGMQHCCGLVSGQMLASAAQTDGSRRNRWVCRSKILPASGVQGASITLER
jgi:hypothetical protein